MADRRAGVLDVLSALAVLYFAFDQASGGRLTKWIEGRFSATPEALPSHGNELRMRDEAAKVIERAEEILRG